MIRTVEQYLESLKDGRVIYCLGEKVEDVTRHPLLRKVIIGRGVMDYVLTNHPKYRHLFVGKNEEGEDVHFLFTPPKSAEDLVRRRDVYVTASKIGGGVALHTMGVDALAASRLAAGRMDKKLGTNYTERVEAYRKYLQKTDLGVTGAMTDVKGDRSLHPSKQVQHKDFYVRVVDRQNDGIIVRGAKMHISSTPGANEAIVLPCRTHGEEDKDYALVFATPLNAKGITLIYSEPRMREVGEAAEWDYPDDYKHPMTECMIVFDDVFVPWERVFMCGEWEFSRDVVYAFATFHRLWADSRMVATLEILTGVSALMAEYNGLERYAHIRDKLSWLVSLSESVDIISKASCLYPDKEPDSDLVTPNAMYSNIAKYTFAENFHEATKVAQDICGGIVVTAPEYRNWMNPEIHPYLDKYLGGKAGISTEDRLRAIRLLKDITGWQYGGTEIHAEGSLAAQKMAFYFNADWERYKAAAKRAARIPGWEKHPYFGSLPDFPPEV